MKRMLLVFSHPDDETYAMGGTIAKYAGSGWDIRLVCATKGESGIKGLYANINEEGLGSIRKKELDQACSILGVTSVTFLDYKDGTLSSQTPGEVEDKIYKIIEEFLPSIVITFDSTGITNHPDHIKISLATTFAYQKYSAWLVKLQKKYKVFARHSEDWFRLVEKIINECMEPKLYYATLPYSVVSYLQKQKVIPKESFEKPWIGMEDKFITTIIDIKRQTSAKIKALKAHISQQEDFQPELELENNPQFQKEFFMLRMVGVHEYFMGKNDPLSDRL